MLAMLFMLLTWSSDAELTRIQAHLAGAERILRAADVSALTPDQRARRAAIIDELGRYRARGRFPRNLDRALPTPSFIDDRGVRCAMAHLIETSGGGALVARVAATANRARIAELADDPELLAWLRTHGLTVAEAARIQPTYLRDVGWLCERDATCRSGRCLPAPDLPGSLVGYCTMACDPAAAQPCPIGMQDQPLTCQPSGGEPLCRYPGQTPGTPGWPCNLEHGGQECFNVCVGDRTTGDGLCAAECRLDPACDDDLACRAQYGLPPRTCVVPAAGSTGCATSEPSPGPCAGLVAAWLVVARRRRARISA